MKLLLTSAGMKIKDEILKILPNIPQKLQLAHIITASKGQDDINYMIRDRKLLIETGFNVTDVDIENKNSNELRKILEDKDIIYVQGGNTFYLLKSAKASGFDKVIIDLICGGKIYIGVSAGSYIACPTIEMATWRHQDRNRFNLTDFTALNLVPFLITAHFKEENRSIIEDAANKIKFQIVALYDTQAILVEGNKFRLVGIGEKEFFNGFKEKY